MSADKVEVVKAKANTAKDDWRNLMDNLKQRETALQVLLKQNTYIHKNEFLNSDSAVPYDFCKFLLNTGFKIICTLQTKVAIL